MKSQELTSPASTEPKREEGDQSFHVGDHVYFRDRQGQHCTGEVKAHGKTGFSAKSQAGMHQVPWDCYVAHKSRKPRKVRIVDEGEDGSLGKLDDGKLIFISRQPDARSDAAPAMHKALPRVLFLKGIKPMTLGDCASGDEERACWPSGYLKPINGDRVFVMVPGFARPVIVSARVFATGAGRLRVRVTNIAGPAESEAAIGQTMPLTEVWRCYGDPKVKSDLSGYYADDSDRIQRNADQRAVYDDATRKAVLAARATQGHRPIDAATLRIGDSICGWDGGQRVDYEVADVDDYSVSLFEVGARERFIGNGKHRRRLTDMSFSVFSPEDRQLAMERFTVDPAFGKSLLILPGALLKAGPIKNRPGLTQEERTDKDGTQVKRWVRTDKDEGGKAKGAPAAVEEKPGDKGGNGNGPSGPRGAHDAKVGEHITYKGADGETATGKVVGTGDEGLTVEGVGGVKAHVRWEDAKAGHVHEPARFGTSKVGDDDIAGFKKHAGETEEQQGKASGHSGVEDDEPAVYRQAVAGLRDFKDVVNRSGGLADKLHAEVFDSDSDAAMEYLDQHPDRSVIMIAPLKGRDRAGEKASTEGWTNVRDIVRGSIVVPSLDQVGDAVKAVKAAGLSIVRMKNRFHDPVGGYRDILMNVRMPNGHVGELQIHAAPMLQAKQKFGGHDHYKAWRDLSESAERGKKMNDEEQGRLDHADNHMRDLYDTTWQGMRGSL